MLKLNQNKILMIALLLVVSVTYLTESSQLSLQDYCSELISYSTLVSSSHNRSNVIVIEKNIPIESYFKFLDSVIKTKDSILPYTLTEHILVSANPWIIDTLQNTDYYRRIDKDSFVYNQRKMIALHKGNRLLIPNIVEAQKFITDFQQTHIDINIPEFKLRIYKNSSLIHECLIRVGKNEKKYLEMSGRVQDLRTKTGEGIVFGHDRNPKYFDPVSNYEYFTTKRDDNRRTKLPQIPFIETEINGLRIGQLIHPTTNPITLGKAYSNGCIGTSESDAWLIYYYAPVNTRITIRYDLSVTNKKGEIILLDDIYDYNQKE